MLMLLLAAISPERVVPLFATISPAAFSYYLGHFQRRRGHFAFPSNCAVRLFIKDASDQGAN
jgi:hypothetical protein